MVNKKMVSQNPNPQVQELISFLYDYTKGWLEGDNRKPLEPIECDYDEEENEVYCVVLVERREDDPKLLQNRNYRQWRTYDDITDYGKIIVREIADWKGTQIVFELYPDLE